MGRFRNYAGTVVNGMQVLRRVERKSNIPYWECVCVCGAMIEIRRDHLESGSRCSACGAARSHAARAESGRHIKHGMTGTAEYAAWSHMKQRCHNPATKFYHRYGGRGIEVCAEWRDDFDAFFAHVGLKPTAAHTLDRIDNSRGYEPGNVRWATRQEQQNNFCRNRIVTYAGDRMTLIQAIRKAGLPESTVRNRLYKGWSEARALTEPVRRQAA